MEKRGVYVWMVLSIMLSLLFRFYLIIEYSIIHQTGIDGFFYHIEANVLINAHGYTWWLHFLSFIGLYPYSDSPAIPTYIAELSILSGLPIDSVALIYSCLIVLIGVTTMYILSLRIFKSIYISFIISFIFGLAPILIPRTIWDIGERESLIYLLPGFVIIILKTINVNFTIYGRKDHKKPLLLIVFLYFTILITTHLTALFLYGIFVSLIIIKILDKFRLKALSRKYVYIKPFFYLVLSGILLYSLFIANEFLTLPYRFSIKNYESSALFSGTDPVTILLNMGVSYSGGIGILFPIFFPLGFLYLIFKKRSTAVEKFFLWMFIVSLPITINRLYSRPVMVFTGAILIGYGIVYIKDRYNLRLNKYNIYRTTKILFILVILISTMLFSSFMYSHWNTQFNSEYAIKYSRHATSSTYEAGLYQKYNIKRIWISNDWLTAQRIQAYSNIPMQPAPLGTPLNNNPVYYNLVNRSTLKIEKSETFYRYTGRFYYSEYYSIQHRDYFSFFKNKNSYMKILSKYNINYIVLNVKANDSFLDYHSHRLIKGKNIIFIKDNSYKIYQNGMYEIYFI